MSASNRDSHARDAGPQEAALQAGVREAEFARVNAQLRTAPRVAWLGAHTSGEDWALDLPRDKVAAVDYLLGMERARGIELESIRALRRRIEGSGGRQIATLRRRWLAGLFAVIVVGCVAVWWQGRSPSDGASVRSAGATVADHSAHQAMGSGVAIQLSDSQLTASRTIGKPGLTTFILRNTGTQAREFVVVPRARIRRRAALMSADELHAAAVAAKHDLDPGSREELAVELVAGQYVLLSSRPGGGMRSAPFRVA